MWLSSCAEVSVPVLCRLGLSEDREGDVRLLVVLFSWNFRTLSIASTELELALQIRLSADGSKSGFHV